MFASSSACVVAYMHRPILSFKFDVLVIVSLFIFLHATLCWSEG